MTATAPLGPQRRVLWEDAHAGPIVARIAVAGDFLPAGKLSVPAGVWRDAARGLATHFDDVAISFMNLECALAADGLSARPLLGLGQIVSAPAASLDFLEIIRAHPVGLGNNHAYDFRAAGVDRTRGELVRRGMVPLGAGRALRSAPEVFLWEGPGEIRIGFWAAARASRDLATRRSPGVEPATVARAAEAMEALRSRGARFAIALLHSGCLRTNRPDPADMDLMDAVAGCGFGVVAASHSHRISGAKFIESREGVSAFCFYGLGSLVSGFVASPLEREGLIVVAGFDSRGKLARVEVRPVLLAQSGFGEAPSCEMGRVILERFSDLSAEIRSGTSGRRFYDDVSPGLLPLYLRDARAAFRESGLRGLARKASRLRVRHLRRLLHRAIA
ncbi:MAG TPA: CapA family protein [Candidatus Acidoferrales bacterium]|nr:CapA family protein [Candidatus Acidoferrales bacterium]